MYANSASPLAGSMHALVTKNAEALAGPGE